MKEDGKLLAGAETISEEQIQKVLEKYDTESKVRTFKNKGLNYFIFIFAVLYAAFHFYATFNPLPTLLQRASHLLFALGLFTCFIRHLKSKIGRKYLFMTGFYSDLLFYPVYTYLPNIKIS